MSSRSLLSFGPLKSSFVQVQPSAAPHLTYGGVELDEAKRPLLI